MRSILTAFDQEDSKGAKNKEQEQKILELMQQVRLIIVTDSWLDIGVSFSYRNTVNLQKILLVVPFLKECLHYRNHLTTVLFNNCYINLIIL